MGYSPNYCPLSDSNAQVQTTRLKYIPTLEPSVMQRNVDAVNVGMCGSDNGHDFRVINERKAEVQIEYTADGKQAWFARNRFERQSGELVLQ